ncbi:carbon-nitrogen hydrolase family protein [bacterium]|nr:carbon-nitrogen hydrolase family protein [bacterium]
MDFITAGIQINSYPYDFASNIKKICFWLNKAVKDFDADFAIFPETVTTGFSPNMDKEEFYWSLPESLDECLKPVKKIAKASKTHCIIPTYERGKEEGSIYNSAVLINDRGKIEGIYRKTHLFPTERLENGGWTTSGNDIPVFETKYGKIGIMICYDGDFPELARIMALKGAGFIAHPSAFLRDFEIWDITNRARAYDNQIYVVGVNAVGQDAVGNNYFGHSMIVSPDARKIAQARAGEEIIVARIRTLESNTLSYGSRKLGLIDHLGHRNILCYKQHLSDQRVIAQRSSKSRKRKKK